MTSNQVVAKVVLLGKTNSGKTCLLERFLHHRYVEWVEATIGAAYGTRTLDVRDNRVTLGIWDTAGSERYDAMSRVYYRGATAAIVCYDLTEENSFHRAKYWINELQTYEEYCRIYLCGTKFDLVDQNNSKYKLHVRVVKEYAEQMNSEVFETSSKNGHGVENLFYAIAESCIDEVCTNGTGQDKISSLKDDETVKKSRCC